MSPPELDFAPAMGTLAISGAVLNAYKTRQGRIDESLEGSKGIPSVNPKDKTPMPSFMGHNDKILFDGDHTVDFYALVHQPIDSKDIRRIPGARETPSTRNSNT